MKCEMPPSFPLCDDRVAAYLDCFKKASFTCSADGVAIAAACNAALANIVACTEAKPDGGASD